MAGMMQTSRLMPSLLQSCIRQTYCIWFRTEYGIHPPGPVTYHHFKIKKGPKPPRRKLKGRVPFDKRFEVSSRHVSESVEGGNSQIAEDVALHRVAPTGYIDPDTQKFVSVPEMIPEFVVPDLTGFMLKPYVSYKVPSITQTEFTAENLFNAVYAETLTQAIDKGEITDSTLKQILYPLTEEQVEADSGKTDLPYKDKPGTNK